jgi:hypothetical protein
VVRHESGRLVFDDSAELVIPLDAEFIDELKFVECLSQSIRDTRIGRSIRYFSGAHTDSGLFNAFDVD